MGFDFYFPFREKCWCLGTLRRIACPLCSWQAARQHAHCWPFAVVHMVHQEEFGCSSSFQGLKCAGQGVAGGSFAALEHASILQAFSCLLPACLCQQWYPPACTHSHPGVFSIAGGQADAQQMVGKRSPRGDEGSIKVTADMMNTELLTSQPRR